MPCTAGIRKTEYIMSIKRKSVYIILLLAAAVCVLYGIAVFSIRSGTGFFAVWFLVGAVFAALAWAVKHRLWLSLPRWLKAAVLTVFALGMALFLTVEGLILSGFGSRGEPGLDYIIVLGAQVHEDGPSYVLMRRLNAAAEYLEANPDTVCIVSGGQGANEPFPEAEGMADYLIGIGIDPDRIRLETESSSTAENISNSMKFISPGARVGIVTNNFHVYRAVQTAKRLGLNEPCGIAAGLRVYFLPNNMLREFLSILKFWVIG